MTVKQNLEIEQSKLREKLNAYAAEIESGKSADWDGGRQNSATL